MRNLYVVHFSPSGSTEKIVKAVASEFSGLPVETINLLTPASRKKSYTFGHDDIVIFGMISAGKLFTLSEEIFACLHAEGTPFVGLITYGNAYYGIALKELLERAEKSGFKVSSLAAFIAQYSINSELGTGRPDDRDKEIIREFARKSYDKILSGDLTLHELPKTSWSTWDKGNELIAFREKHPEVPYTLPPEYKSKKISDDCIKCGTCVRNCPVDAIDIDAKTFDTEKCIGCWGCINRCPKHAITSTSGEFAGIVRSFMEASSERREPDLLF